MSRLVPFEIGKYRYQPEPGYGSLSAGDYIFSQQVLAAMVGVIAVGLPIVLLAGVVLGACFHDSISHFYFSRFLSDIFVGSLIVIGSFLISYRGEGSRENLYAWIAGLCAYGVAIFPTIGSGLESGAICEGRSFYETNIDNLGVEAFQLFPGVEKLHYGSAALLFAFLAYYSLRIFTRVIPEEHEDENGNLLPSKVRRDRTYRISGALIVFSIVCLGFYAFFQWDWWNQYNLTFWFEALALWAFGVAWIVKGRFFRKATGLLDRRDIVAAK